MNGASQPAREPIKFDLGAVRQTTSRQALVRFAAGAGASLTAALVSEWAGSTISGPLLALPAILLASLTLIADKDGMSAAVEDARGAIFGGVGLVAFAVVAALLLGSRPTWLVLLLAAVAWVVVSVALYGAQRVLIGRSKTSQESPPSDSGSN